MIPYNQPSISHSDIKAVNKVLRSRMLTRGGIVRDFEEKLSAYLGYKYCIVVSSGTSALHLSVRALGLERGHRAIVPPNTFMATPNSVYNSGGSVIWSEIKPDGNIDEDKIEDLITGDTKIIMPVDYSGKPCNIQKINEIAKEYGLKVIRDSAHAFGVVGNECDITCFSFHAIKTISCGEGGVIATDDEDVAFKCQLMRNNSPGTGFNYNMTDFQAALGISQLERVNEFIDRRKEIAYEYCKALDLVPDDLSVYHLFPIRVDCPTILKPCLIGKGIDTRQMYYPACRYFNETVKSADEFYNHNLCLPIYPELKKQKYIIRELKRCLQQ